MEDDGERRCDSCGQVIPKMSKLATREAGSEGKAKDLSLACQIRQAQVENGLRH